MESPLGAASLAEADPATVSELETVVVAVSGPSSATMRPAAVGPATIKMVVDGIDARGCITGWAYAEDRPHERVSLSLLHENECAASTLAELPRPDLGRAGMGDGRSGFALRVPEHLLARDVRALSIRAQLPGAIPQQMDIRCALPRALVACARARSDPAVANHAIQRLPAAAGNGAIYVPGYYVTCAMPFPRPVYHTAGWHEPEDGLSWIDGSKAEIEFLVRKPPNGLTLELDVFPHTVGPHPQTLEVVFNFFRVAYFQVANAATVKVELPAELFTLTTSRITLYCDNAVASTQFGGDDPRCLGIAVSGWVLA